MAQNGAVFQQYEVLELSKEASGLTARVKMVLFFVEDMDTLIHYAVAIMLQNAAPFVDTQN